MVCQAYARPPRSPILVHRGASAVSARASSLKLVRARQAVGTGIGQGWIDLRCPALFFKYWLWDLIAQAQVQGELGANLPVVHGVEPPTVYAHRSGLGATNVPVRRCPEKEGCRARPGVRIDGVAVCQISSGSQSVGEAELGRGVAEVVRIEALAPVHHPELPVVVAFNPRHRIVPLVAIVYEGAVVSWRCGHRGCRWRGCTECCYRG